MITITRQENEIRVEGHANYAPEGMDIVCAAVSALTQTLIFSVEELTEDKYTAHIAPGNTTIKFRDLSEQTKLLISSFFIGVNAIADTHLGYVKVVENEC